MPALSMRSLAIPAALGLTAALLLASLVLAREAVAEEPGPLVVKIHADWCGTCQRMTPSWESAEVELGGEARFVVLDVTDADRLAESRSTAEQLGIQSFFDSYKSKTGTVGVLSASGKTAQTFKGELDVNAVRSAVAEASEA